MVGLVIDGGRIFLLLVQAFPLLGQIQLFLEEFIAVKPNGVQWGLVGKIICHLKEKGFRLCAMKMTTASKDLLEMHIADVSSKPFFPQLVEFMLCGPVVAMVWEGKGAVKTGRKMLGETNPADSLTGTIRGDYCIDIGRNICHGSDSVETAKKEIALWFKEVNLTIIAVLITLGCMNKKATST